MSVLVVIENPEDCALIFSGITPVSARTYLTDESFSALRGVKVVNICKSYRYQSIGYYVSLLAEARGHKPIPSITTIQDIKSAGIIRLASDELDDVIQKQMADNDPGMEKEKIQVNIYFGRTPDHSSDKNAGRGFDQIASRLFKYFPAPLLQADFTKTGLKNTQWQLQNVSPLPVKKIPAQDRGFVETVAADFLIGKTPVIPKRSVSRYDLAILYDPQEKFPPSDPRALKNFIKAAESLGIGTELITKDDTRRLSEFDALFIRETTSVDHHTYRTARKAWAEGLVVIDDPVSILRCSNKVYLAELMSRHKIPAPATLIVHNKNVEKILEDIRLPCILKQPDSSFSQGVIMVSDPDQLAAETGRLLKKSELIIAQEFLPTDFDWRIGILDRRPLFACKYFMARQHWQIYNHAKNGKTSSGKVETLPVWKAPKKVVNTALKVANLIGDGLYGVDIKMIGKRVTVIEVNDNPNVDSGIEDEILKDDLYLRVMEVFLKRIEAVKTGVKIS